MGVSNLVLVVVVRLWAGDFVGRLAASAGEEAKEPVPETTEDNSYGSDTSRQSGEEHGKSTGVQICNHSTSIGGGTKDEAPPVARIP